MTLIDQLLAVADAYAEPEQLKRSTVSWRVFGDAKKLSSIADGADLQTRRFEAAIAWFADNWPDAAMWPVSVRRPDLAA